MKKTLLSLAPVSIETLKSLIQRVVSLIWWKSYEASPAVSDFPTFMQRPLL
jgi:hypothetical protein